MRIIVISDTHGFYNRLYSIVMRNPKADAFIHLGDCVDECRDLLRNFPDLAGKFFYVRGNCDYGSDAPVFKTIDIAPGHRIFATHGDRFGVKYDLGTLITTAKENECDIALFGHTHERLCTYEDGVYIMNPGSAACPRDGKPCSYGFIDITDAGIVTNNVSIT